MKDPTKSPVWHESIAAMKLIIRATVADTGLLFLEQNGSVVCILGTAKDQSDMAALNSLKLFRDRLDDLINKVDSEEVSLKADKAVFIRDESGNFHERLE